VRCQSPNLHDEKNGWSEVDYAPKPLFDTLNNYLQNEPKGRKGNATTMVSKRGTKSGSRGQIYD
jgi:hypothetical protein